MSLLRPVPGSGQILRVVLRYASHDRHRFPRVQAFVADCRVGQWATASAGTRAGPSGTQLGTASLTGAFAAAAVRFLRHTPAGQQLRTRLAKNHGQGNALTVLAHPWARAVYDRWHRGTAFELDTFLQASGSRAGEPTASLDCPRIRLATAR